MKCPICNRDNLTERELEMHNRYFHKVGIDKISSMQKQPEQKIVAGVCPECGAALWTEGGCIHCHSCGYERCV